MHEWSMEAKFEHIECKANVWQMNIHSMVDEHMNIWSDVCIASLNRKWFLDKVWLDIFLHNKNLRHTNMSKMFNPKHIVSVRCVL